MTIKISKADAKIMIEQSKQMIEIGKVNIDIAEKAIKRSNIDMTSAKAIIKYLGGK